ncbi:MAG: hypothetical protein HYW49_12530 [Deltaproteobacteria bacterium]|nr:hypothetical protein [Deltaproteobacteria bacterium]
MKIKRCFLPVLASLTFAACGDDSRDRENYGDISKGSGGIVLQDSAEHRGGFGRRQCLVCHYAALNIHRGADSIINADELNKAVQQRGEEEYCMTCHGVNGTK